MISIQNLHKAYGAHVLFSGSSLQMNRGEKLGLIGRNGHGKSTLFRIILGEEEAEEGSVIIPKNYRIGHLTQQLHFTQNTIADEACLGLPAGEEHARYKAERILSGLGFSNEDFEKPPHSFSGGFQIRINLAKLLVSDPDLLLLDEPTNHLDMPSVEALVESLKNLEREICKKFGRLEEVSGKHDALSKK